MTLKIAGFPAMEHRLFDELMVFTKNFQKGKNKPCPFSAGTLPTVRLQKKGDVGEVTFSMLSEQQTVIGTHILSIFT